MRLIDADELRWTSLQDGFGRINTCIVFESDVNAMPTIEIEGRECGRWEGYHADDPQWLRKDGSPIFLICSKCGETIFNGLSAHWNYCPNCGAKMENENEAD